MRHAAARAADFETLSVDARNQQLALQRGASDDTLAQRYARHADRIIDATHSTFSDTSRGLYADDVTHESYSEHTQALAILEGSLAAAFRERVGKALIERAKLTPADDLLFALCFRSPPPAGPRGLHHGSHGPVVRSREVRLQDDAGDARADAIGLPRVGSASGVPFLRDDRRHPSDGGGDERCPKSARRPGALTSFAAKMVHPAGGFVEVSLNNGRYTASVRAGVTGELVVGDRRIALVPGGSVTTEA